MSQVELREINRDNVRAILRLKVKPEQEKFVADNATSLAEALFEEKAWYRAIYAQNEPVGFVQLFDDPDQPFYYVWRFMIAGPYQGMGYGAKAMRLVIEYVKTRPNATELKLSYVPDQKGPEHFYAKLGFENTGEIEGDEHIMQLVL